jgi:GNAT superfamily N-acetyltransferase
VIRELAAGETHLAYDAMAALRPHVGSAQDFVRRVDDVQRPAGYRLIGFFVDGAEQAVAAAGFRTNDYLAWGHSLYCDDLSTLPEARGKGYAGALLDWMIEEARRQGCGEFHLDSGVQADRESAHRLYFNKRMRISSYHFSRKV